MSKRKFKKIYHRTTQTIILCVLCLLTQSVFANSNSKSKVIYQPQKKAMSIYDTFESKHYDTCTPTNIYYGKNLLQNQECLGTMSEVVFGVGIHMLPNDNVGTTFQKNGTATSISEQILYLGNKKEKQTYNITYTIRDKKYSACDNVNNKEELIEGDFTFEYDGERAVVFPTPKGKGQVFLGWYDNPKYDGQKIESLPNFFYKNIDLYAKFNDPIR